MNDLAAGPKPGAPDKALARHVLNAASFDVANALKEHGGERLQATREALHRQLLPLGKAEPKFDGPHSEELAKYLSIIGAAVLPTMSAGQANAWVKAVRIKLADLPSRCVCQAANDAVHKAFGYIAEAEQFIRVKADELHMRQRLAIRRLDMMQAELQRLQTPAIEDRWTGEPITDAQVHQWQRTSLGRSIIRMGLAAGFIQPEQLAEPLPPEEERE